LVLGVVTADGACDATPTDAVVGVTLETALEAPKLTAPPTVGILATAARVTLAITVLVAAVSVSFEETPWA
jgi:hypothetical protein